jgi:hypothetical protein
MAHKISVKIMLIVKVVWVFFFFLEFYCHFKILSVTAQHSSFTDMWTINRIEFLRLI